MEKSIPWRCLCRRQWLCDTCEPLSALEVWLSKEFCKLMKCFYYFVTVTSFLFFIVLVQDQNSCSLPFTWASF